jgi:pyruvate kinase
MNKIKIICTIGPSSLKSNILREMSKESVDLFRINMSHTNLSDLPKVVKKLKKFVGKNKICIDTEGAQLRTTSTKNKIILKKGKKIKIFNNNFFSNSQQICLYPKFDISDIKINSKIFVGFDGIILQVLKKNIKKNYLLAKVINSGLLESNKGVHINKKIKLNCLTNKDKSAIIYAKKIGINNFAMSFVNHPDDIKSIRKIIGYKSYLISKIETLDALKNIKKISKASNALLIDRGDLSREVPIEKIPVAQEYVLNNFKKGKIPVFVATNLLETMIKTSLPTRAESHDIYSTLKSGASGLVLAAESAIGTNPVECVKFLKKCVNVFNEKNEIKFN